MSAQVIVNGDTYELFKQIDWSYDLDNTLADCRILVSQQVAGRNFIRVQDEVRILFDGVPFLTGYVDDISDDEQLGTHDIGYKVRGRLADLVDSTVPQSIQAVESVDSLRKLCEIVIDALGLRISVTDEAGVRFTDSVAAAGVGQGCIDYLASYARKAGAFLGEDGDGNMVIRRPRGVLSTQLVSIDGFTRSNIKTAALSIDYTGRYHRYVVRSNGSIAAGDIDNAGVAIDSEIRPSRVYEKIAESPMTAEECQRAADEEANVRRVRSWSYRCSVAGASANGEPWLPGKLVSVKDLKRQVFGLYLLKGVAVTASSGGEIATLSLAYPDAYQAQAETTAIEDRTTSPATIYTVQPGDTLGDISSRFGVPLAAVIAANPQVENPDLIYPDGEIKIPAGGVT